MREDEEEHTYTFSFTVSGEIEIIANSEEEAEAAIENALMDVRIDRQSVDVDIEACTLSEIDGRLMTVNQSVARSLHRRRDADL